MALLHCGKINGPLFYHFEGESPDIDKEMFLDAVSELNKRIGCEWIIMSDELGGSVSFPERQNMGIAIGNFNADKHEGINVSEYNSAPYVYGNSKIKSKTDDSPDAVMARDGFKRVVIHELGHAMRLPDIIGLENSSEIMYSETDFIKQPISDANWFNYIEDLRKAGVECQKTSQSTN